VERRVQVIAVPDIGGIVIDPDLDVEITGRTAGRAGLALPGQLDPGTGSNTGRDLDGQ
jgi:hypothetical protein